MAGTSKFKWQTLCFLVISAFIMVVALAPFAFLLISSFKPGQELLRGGITFSMDFSIMHFNNYGLLFTDNNGLYFRWYFNSVFITVLQTSLALFLSSMVGYGLGVYQFKGRNIIFVMVLLVMMVPVEILLLPLFRMLINIGLTNTYAGVVLPFAVSPFAIFFFRQYAVSLPQDFLDAARIDGCGEYKIFLRICLPLMMPAVSAMMILLAMGSWNAVLWPMVVMGSRAMMTLPVGLSTMITPYGNNYDMLLPGSVLAIVPILIIFLFNQRFFIEGMTSSGVKG